MYNIKTRTKPYERFHDWVKKPDPIKPQRSAPVWRRPKADKPIHPHYPQQYDNSTNAHAYIRSCPSPQTVNRDSLGLRGLPLAGRRGPGGCARDRIVWRGYVREVRGFGVAEGGSDKHAGYQKTRSRFGSSCRFVSQLSLESGISAYRGQIIVTTQNSRSLADSLIR